MNKSTLHHIQLFARAQYHLSKDPLHNFSHIERVVQNARRIVHTLKLQNTVDEHVLTACCYLHDVVIVGENNKREGLWHQIKNHVREPQMNKNHLPKILQQFDLSKSEYAVIYNAIINHPHSIPYRRLNKKRDIYTKILQDADTLDYVSHERVVHGEQLLGTLGKGLIYMYVTLVRKCISWFLNLPESEKILVTRPAHTPSPSAHLRG